MVIFLLNPWLGPQLFWSILLGVPEDREDRSE